MPNVTIGTYSEYEFEVGGNVFNVPVTKIISEDENIDEITQEVSIFGKYTTKRHIRANAKNKVEEKKILLDRKEMEEYINLTDSATNDGAIVGNKKDADSQHVM